MQNDQLRKVLNEISPVQFGVQHQSRREARTPETCEWLLQHEVFREWEESSSSSILWLQGSVGTGKSVLTSKVIDRFMEASRSESDEGFAYFYCDRGVIDHQEPDSILRSYVRQLSTVLRHPARMQKKLVELYQQSQRSAAKLSFGDCRGYMLDTIHLYPKTTIVLDALDECNERTRGKLVELFVELVSKSQRLVKVFISSRREVDIVKMLPAGYVVGISAENNGGDIERFIEKEIQEMDQKGKWQSVSDTLKDKIRDKLRAGGDGMFRCVYLQMKQLQECELPQDIEDRLGKLPQDLGAAYDEIFNRMSAHEKVVVERAATDSTRDNQRCNKS
ncbi:hypothetical protein CDD83_2834 [Cordyceps sp. RAO-2017]|nr:hypothetical protein CDD83_2834 [Cordyceps sp. RAO-2017]